MMEIDLNPGLSLPAHAARRKKPEDLHRMPLCFLMAKMRPNGLGVTVEWLYGSQ